MKIQVNIPDGHYCEDCKFRIAKQCAYLHGAHLAAGYDGIIKNDNCPNKDRR